MPRCYMMITIGVTDDEKFEEYLAAVDPTLKGHEFSVLAYDLEPDLIEGELDRQRAAILEWPSKEAAHAWLDSPAYREIVGLRHESADSTIVIVDALN